MMKCQCKTRKGTQCARTGSKKKGADPVYCYQHQSCSDRINSTTNSSTTTSTSTSTSATSAAGRAVAAAGLTNEMLIGAPEVMEGIALSLKSREDIQALCQTNKRFAAACAASAIIQAHMNALGPPIENFGRSDYWDGKGRYGTLVDGVILSNMPQITKRLEEAKSGKNQKSDVKRDLVTIQDSVNRLQELANLLYEWGNNGDYYPNVQRRYELISPPEVDFDDAQILSDGPREDDWYHAWINEQVDEETEDLWKLLNKYPELHILSIA